MGAGFYDDTAAVQRYLQHRHGGVASPNLMMEEPAFWKALGQVDGLRVADLGCGDAAMAPPLLAAGAVSYLGLDASAPMVSAARAALAGVPGARIEQAAIESFTAEPSSFDVIVSRLALHYVANLDSVLSACASALVSGGRLVFSVVHPLITSHEAVHAREQPRTSWLVDDYFKHGPRRREWFDSVVTWQHRTVEDYLTATLQAGFTVTALSECRPVRDRFGDNQAEFTRRCRVPLFLLLAGQLH